MDTREHTSVLYLLPGACVPRTRGCRAQSRRGSQRLRGRVPGRGKQRVFARSLTHSLIHSDSLTPLTHSHTFPTGLIFLPDPDEFECVRCAADCAAHTCGRRRRLGEEMAVLAPAIGFSTTKICETPTRGLASRSSTPGSAATAATAAPSLLCAGASNGLRWGQGMAYSQRRG